MVFQAQNVINELSMELLTLDKELRTIGKTEKITIYTLFVYSALKSGVTNPEEIAKNFLMDVRTANLELHKLIPVRYKILNLRHEKKSKFIPPVINIYMTTLPDKMQETIIDNTPPVIEEEQKPIDRKARLKSLQL